MAVKGSRYLAEEQVGDDKSEYYVLDMADYGRMICEAMSEQDVELIVLALNAYDIRTRTT